MAGSITTSLDNQNFHFFYSSAILSYHFRVRAKRILGWKNINIYALGIYVDNVAAKRQLAGRFKGVCEKDLSKDQALFDGQSSNTEKLQ